MRQWRCSGFSVHIRSKAADAEGRQRLARYMIRCPFALNKMSYDHKSGMLTYRSKPHATLKRNYRLMPALHAATHEPYSGPGRTPGALLRLLLQPLSRGRQKAEQEDDVPLSIIKLIVINSPDNGQKWRDN